MRNRKLPDRSHHRSPNFELSPAQYEGVFGRELVAVIAVDPLAR